MGIDYAKRSMAEDPAPSVVSPASPSQSSTGNSEADPVMDHLSSLLSRSEFGEHFSSLRELLHGCPKSALNAILIKLRLSVSQRKRSANTVSTIPTSSTSSSSRQAKVVGFNPVPKSGAASGKRKLTAAQQNRASAYKRVQDTYTKDKRRLVASLVNGVSLETPVEHPDNDAVESAYL